MFNEFPIKKKGKHTNGVCIRKRDVKVKKNQKTLYTYCVLYILNQ